MQGQGGHDFQIFGETKILTDERIAEFSNKLNKKSSISEQIKKRKPYTKFDFKTKLKIFRDLEGGRDLTEIAIEFNVSPRRIRRVGKYNVLFKETTEKYNDRDGRKESLVTEDRTTKEKNILLKKGLKFFEMYQVRPSILALAQVYLNDNEFFGSNSKKVNFTRRLKKYISKSIGLSQDSEALNAKPFSRKKTLEMLTSEGNFKGETAIENLTQLRSSKVPFLRQKSSQYFPKEIPHIEYNGAEDLESFNIESFDEIEESPLKEFHENPLDCFLNNSAPSIPYLDI